MRRVDAKRGDRAAEQLRGDMREQWRTRSTWWNESSETRRNS
ncbi:hypothetical protein [Dyella japonica]